MGKKEEHKKGGKRKPEREVIRELFKRKFKETELVLYSRVELYADVNTIARHNGLCPEHLSHATSWLE